MMTCHDDMMTHNTSEIFCTPANAVSPFQNRHFLTHRPPQLLHFLKIFAAEQTHFYLGKMAIFFKIAPHAESPPRSHLCVDKIESPPRSHLCVDKIRSRPSGRYRIARPHGRATQSKSCAPRGSRLIEIHRT